MNKIPVPPLRTELEYKPIIKDHPTNVLGGLFYPWAVLVLHRFNCASVLIRPSFKNPIMACYRRNTVTSTVVRKARINTIHGEEDHSLLFIYLFFLSSPSTVLWCIISVIIYAVYSVFWRSFTHIFKEVSKAFKPSIAYFNPTTTVIFVFLLFGVITSFLNRVIAIPSVAVFFIATVPVVRVIFTPMHTFGTPLTRVNIKPTFIGLKNMSTGTLHNIRFVFNYLDDSKRTLVNLGHESSIA